MSALASEVAGLPQSLHRGENELPFVPYQEGVVFQLLQVNTEAGLWVIRVRAEPGVTIQKHRHTGEVFAFTIQGAWKYLEYPEVNVAGSYLFEPAGSIHTLHVPKTNKVVTDVWSAGGHVVCDAVALLIREADLDGHLRAPSGGCPHRTRNAQRRRPCIQLQLTLRR